jgi:hypothetical protein
VAPESIHHFQITAMKMSTSRMLMQMRSLIMIAVLCLVALSAGCSTDDRSDGGGLDSDASVVASLGTSIVTASPTKEPTAVPSTVKRSTAVPTAVIADKTVISSTPTVSVATPVPTPPVPATATVSPDSSASPVPVPVPTVAPTSTSVPTATATATATPSPIVVPTATSTPTPTLTATPIPTGTTLPTPTLQPTVGNFPTATATITPTPTPDPRYGVVLTSDESHVVSIGVESYVQFNPSPANVPAGTDKIIYITSVNPVPHADIARAASAKPGSIWYVLGEPNARGTSAQDVVVGLHDTYAAIKAADPSAKITSPSLLNFDFTCIACGGYTSGKTWADQFRQEYLNLYGIEPPVDYWAIDLYPIIWDPNALPTTETSFIYSDLNSFRSYLDAIPDQAGKPMIITELGLHWGYSEMTLTDPNCDGWYPAGNYEQQMVEDYFSEIFIWLESNASRLVLTNWYVFSTHRDLTSCLADLGYGLTMFDGSGASANRTEFGDYLRDWVRGVRP